MTEEERRIQEFKARMLSQSAPPAAPQMSPVPNQQGQMSPENMALLRGQAAYDPGRREAILADQLRGGRDQIFAKGPQGKQMGNIYAAPTWSENLSGAVKKGLGGLEMARARKGLREVDDLRGVASEAEGLAGSGEKAKAEKYLNAIRRYGISLSGPDHLQIVQMHGKAAAGYADKKLSELK